MKLHLRRFWHHSCAGELGGHHTGRDRLAVAPATVWALAASEVLAHDGLVPASKQRRYVCGLASEVYAMAALVWAPACRCGALGRAAASLELVLTVGELAVFAIRADAPLPPV